MIHEKKKLLFYTVLSRVNSPSCLGVGGCFMAVISVGRFGLGAIGGGTLAIASPPNSEDDEDESERRRLAAAPFEFPAKKGPLSFEFTAFMPNLNL